MRRGGGSAARNGGVAARDIIGGGSGGPGDRRAAAPHRKRRRRTASKRVGSWRYVCIAGAASADVTLGSAACSPAARLKRHGGGDSNEALASTAAKTLMSQRCLQRR